MVFKKLAYVTLLFVNDSFQKELSLAKKTNSALKSVQSMAGHAILTPQPVSRRLRRVLTQ